MANGVGRINMGIRPGQVGTTPGGQEDRWRSRKEKCANAMNTCFVSFALAHF